MAEHAAGKGSVPDWWKFCSGAASGEGSEGVAGTHFYAASSRLSYSLNSFKVGLI